MVVNRKRLFRLGAWGFGTAVALLAALPLWFPWLLSVVLPRLGANIGVYERLGWSGYVLRDVVYDDEYVRVTLGEARGRQPLALVFDRVGGGSDVQVGFTVDDWRVEIKDSDTSGTSSSIRSVPDVAELVDLIGSLLQDWLPAADLSDGRITGSGFTIDIPTAAWRDGVLELSAYAPDWEVGVTGMVELGSSGGVTAGFVAAPEPVELNFALTTGTKLDGKVRWLTNRVDINAEFDRDEWMPKTMTVVGRDMHFPAERLNVDGYDEIRADLAGRYDGERLMFDIRASAEPTPDRMEDLDTAEAEMNGTVDFSSISIERLNVQTPALEIALSNAIHVDLDTLAVAAPASVSINADLEKLPFLNARGAVSGEITFVPDDDRIPDVTFAVTGGSLAAFGVELEKVLLEGRIEENILNLVRAEASDVRGFDMRAAGQISLDPLHIDGVRGELRAGPAFVGPWLPVGWEFQGVQVDDLQIEGRPDSLNHSGKLDVQGIKHAGLRSTDAEILWKGSGIETVSADIGLNTARAGIEAQLSLEGLKRLRLESLVFRHGSGPDVRLVAPATADIQFTGDGVAEVVVDQFEISDGMDIGMKVQGRLRWPDSGDVQISGQGLRPDLIAGFYERELPDASVNSFTAHAEWNEGPVKWSLKTDMAARVIEGASLRLDAELSGGRAGTDVSRVIMTTKGERLVEANGVFPLAVVPSDENRPIRLPEDGDVSGQMSWNLSDQIVGVIERLTSVRLSDVSGTVKLGGTVSEPIANLSLNSGAAWLTSSNDSSRLRLMDELRIESSLTPVVLSLSDVVMKVGREEVELDGTIPLAAIPTGAWTQESILELFGQTSLSISIPKMSVSQLDAFLPTELKREGSVALRMRLEPGNPIEGEFEFSGLSTLPLPGLGSIRDIQGRLIIGNGQAVLAAVSCQLGSRTANITGTVKLDPEDLLAGTLPKFDLRLLGEEIPLVRDTGMIVRSDLDITLINDGEAPPIVGGDVTLRRSFFRSELDLLAFNDVSVPAMKPPFFSIADPPLNEWRFDLRIRGDRFMIVRSPIFKGVVSANLQLQGDFEEPQLLGDIVVPQGTLTFPFANLYITRAMVTATAANPNDPRLLASAISRISDYSITMNASGSLSDPVITFSSSPPLTSKEILLLISAGKMPARTDDLSTSDRMGKLAIFLGKDLINKFGTGEPTEDRWVVRSGEHTSTAGKPTYYIEYLVTDDWSLVGEYDEYDAVNAGVKWRLLGR